MIALCISKMHTLSSSSSYRLIYRASLGLQGRFRKVGILAYLTHPLPQIPVPRTGKKSINSEHTAQRADFQPLTVEDYHVLIESGNLEGQPIELLNGVLVRTLSQSAEQAYTTSTLARIFSRALEDQNRAVVHDSKPITLKKSNSEPEPDVVIASGFTDNYAHRHPVPDDIFLIVEVSKSTPSKDSTEKLELYALENIQEYWIVDIMNRSVRVLRNPEEKCYLHDETFYAGDIVPATFPDVVINVEELFCHLRC